MKKSIIAILLAAASFDVAADSSFGPGEDPQKFYRPFAIKSIPLSEMQSWPNCKYVSRHMADFVAHGVVDIAEGKAGNAFYSTAKDVARDVSAKGPTGEFLAQGAGKVTYGMQTYYLPDLNILMSMGSFG